MSYKVLVINPGSTSTKIAVFEDKTMLFDKTLRHSAEDIAKFESVAAQKDWRRSLIEEALEENNVDPKTLSAIASRGGLTRPIAGGTYLVNEAMKDDYRAARYGEHACNVGGLIADDMACELGIKAYVTDPPVVDELAPVARYSGHPAITRHVLWHALNQKAVAHRYAESVGKKYEELNLIVCHMGGGVSVGAHQQGNVVETQNALDGDGPFSPERSGSLPVGDVVNLCFSGKYTRADMKKLSTGQGGMMAYLGTTDMRKISEDAKTDPKTAEVLEAFCYQIAREIGACAASLQGKVDQIILTGGIAYGADTVAAISKYIQWIAPITVYPGEDELLALAEGTLRVLNGEEEAKDYQ